MRKILFAILFVFLPLCAFADKEEVSHFLREITPQGKCLAKVDFSSVEEVEVLYIEMDADELEEGTYEIELTRVDSHLYRIEGTKIYLYMKYCYEYFFWEKVFLKVTKSYGRLYGEVTY